MLGKIKLRPYKYAELLFMRIVTSSIIKNSNSGRGKGGVDDKFTDLQNLQFNHICDGHVI